MLDQKHVGLQKGVNGCIKAWSQKSAQKHYIITIPLTSKVKLFT